MRLSEGWLSRLGLPEGWLSRLRSGLSRLGSWLRLLRSRLIIGVLFSQDCSLGSLLSVDSLLDLIKQTLCLGSSRVELLLRLLLSGSWSRLWLLLWLLLELRLELSLRLLLLKLLLIS